MFGWKSFMISMTSAKKYFPFFVICVFLVTSGCTKRTTNADQKPIIVTSIAPLASIIHEIGGEDFEIVTLVPPNANPHTFDLTPEDIRKSSTASLLVLNGAGLEFWADKLQENISTNNLLVVTLADGLKIESETGHASGNPHIWLDPLLILKSVDRIGAAMISVLPERKSELTRRMNAFADSLLELDKEIRNEISSWRDRSFVAYHASWIYFSHRYGLRQLAVLERHQGHELSPMEFAELVKFMRERSKNAVFGEVQFSRKPIDALILETDARLAMLDPLGTRTTSYTALLRTNLSLMASVLK